MILCLATSHFETLVQSAKKFAENADVNAKSDTILHKDFELGGTGNKEGGQGGLTE